MPSIFNIYKHLLGCPGGPSRTGVVGGPRAEGEDKRNLPEGSRELVSPSRVERQGCLADINTRSEGKSVLFSFSPSMAAE